MGRKQSRNAARVAKKRRTNVKPMVGTGRVSENVEASSKVLKKKRRRGEGGEDEFESERKDMEERFLAKEYARESRRGAKKHGGLYGSGGRISRGGGVAGCGARAT